MPPPGGILVQLLAFLGTLALLVGNAAAGLAGGLAGGLAFAAATVLGAVTQVAGLDGLDVLHGVSPSIRKILPAHFTITMRDCQSHFSYFSSSMQLLDIPSGFYYSITGQPA